MPTPGARLVGLGCLLLFCVGCAGKGNMGHVKVEQTQFAAQQGLTVKDWSWSGSTFAVQLATSDKYTGTWNMFAQMFDAQGKPIGQEIRFLNSNMKAGQTSWSEIPDLKLTDKTARVVFDIQSATQIRRQPHY